jgi:uncharacterized membrane protein
MSSAAADVRWWCGEGSERFQTALSTNSIGAGAPDCTGGKARKGGAQDGKRKCSSVARASNNDEEAGPSHAPTAG